MGKIVVFVFELGEIFENSQKSRSHHFIAVLRRRGTFWWPSQSSSAKMLDPEALPATARPGSPGSDDSAPSLRAAPSSPSNSNSSEFAEPPSEAAVEASRPKR